MRALRARVEKNFSVLDAFVCKTPWLEYLAKDPRTRSNTSVCLDIVDPVITALSVEKRASFIKAVVNRLDEEGVAYDIGSYRDAPPGLRVWTGITIEASDIEILTEWLEWAFQVEKALL
ncbi:phosphoserine aminotransferase [Bartonella japonica]|uniref:Phosphoserine aminotransferase n=1 Tax=Bartonella japonica TaxID=357761 RepID=A0ABV2FPB3_9HYPH